MQASTQKWWPNRNELIGFLPLLIVYAGGTFFRLIYPSLHLDESLYVGAAKSIWSGDYFLNRFWVDKPILSFWLMIPGMLLAGENALGYHLSSWLLGLTTIWILYRFAERRNPIENKFIRVFTSYGFVCLFLTPFMNFYWAGSFTDSYCLFFLILMMQRLYLAEETPEEPKYFAQAGLCFSLAFFCKQSALLWFPLLISHMWDGSLKWKSIRSTLQSSIREFWLATRRWWFIFLGCSLLTNNKLGWLLPIFSGTRMNSDLPNRFYIFMNRLVLIYECLCSSSNWGWILALPFVALLLVLFSWKKLSTFVKRLVLLFIAQLALLLITTGPLYERYLFLILPILYFSLFLGMRDLKSQKNKAQFRTLLALLLISLFLPFPFSYQKILIHKVLPDRTKNLPDEAQNLAMLEMQILPPGSILHDLNFRWHRFPYEISPASSSSIKRFCPDPDCILDAEQSLHQRPIQARLFQKDEIPEHNLNYEIFLRDNGLPEVEGASQKSEWQTRIAAGMKLKNFGEEKFDLDEKKEIGIPDNRARLTWIQNTRKFKFETVRGSLHIEAQGHLSIYPPQLAGEKSQIIAKIEGFYVNGFDLTDLYQSIRQPVFDIGLSTP